MGVVSQDVTAFPVYWDRQTWDLSRSAFVADLDDVPASPESWVGWLEAALRAHLARSSRVRADMAVPPPPRRPAGSRAEGQLNGEPPERFTKTHLLPTELVDRLEQAIAEDRRKTGRMVSRSGFAREATLAAIEATRTRRGRRRMPPPPERLPTRPPKRASRA